MSSGLQRLEAALTKHAVGFPEVTEELPWGDRVFKVRGKIFLFLNMFDKGQLSLTVKLPHSSLAALALPCASPTAYGLGKSGWVSFRFASSQAPPADLLREWIDESYKAVAPKRLVAALPGAESRTKLRP